MEIARCIDRNFGTTYGSTSAHPSGEALLKTDNHARNLSQRAACFVQTPQHDHEDEKVVQSMKAQHSVTFNASTV
jgi:hypothetical protein